MKDTRTWKQALDCVASNKLLRKHLYPPHADQLDEPELRSRPNEAPLSWLARRGDCDDCRPDAGCFVV